MGLTIIFGEFLTIRSKSLCVTADGFALMILTPPTGVRIHWKIASAMFTSVINAIVGPISLDRQLAFAPLAYMPFRGLVIVIFFQLVAILELAFMVDAIEWSGVSLGSSVDAVRPVDHTVMLIAVRVPWVVFVRIFLAATGWAFWVVRHWWTMSLLGPLFIVVEWEVM